MSMPRLFPASSTLVRLFLVATACITYASDAQAIGSYALLDGARVHYQNYGDGPTAVVFVHGWACDASFWRSQVNKVAKKWRVIALDLPSMVKVIARGSHIHEPTWRAASMPSLVSQVLSVRFS
jgi:pimeloyl-ACP methyl ester carboxylesterase